MTTGFQFNFAGNEKLGLAAITNRAVGDTCPKSCEFLNDGCYAERSEKLYPTVRARDVANTADRLGLENRLRAGFLHAAKHNLPVRIHERGDWMLHGRFDDHYLRCHITALQSILDDGKQLPSIWLYTHVYNPKILKLEQFNVMVYASVTKPRHIAKAKAAGFKLFAFADTDGVELPHKTRSTNAADVPSWIEIGDLKFLVCPEQRKGRDKVTCAGSLKTKACTWCIAGRGNVAFLKH